MEILSEDPTYLAGGLALLAAVFLVALRFTQQGKYLVWAGAALGVALLCVVIDWLWVTDNERVEQTVYGLAKAVSASDVPGMLSYLDDDVRYTRRSLTMPARATRALAETLVANSKFDILRVSKMRVNVGGQSRRGTVEFRVLATGSIQQGGAHYNFGSVNSTWSLGLREASPGVWKVNRITPVEVPRGEIVLPQ